MLQSFDMSEAGKASSLKQGCTVPEFYRIEPARRRAPGYAASAFASLLQIYTLTPIMAAQEDSIFSLTSFVSLLAVVVLLAVGYYASNALLAKNTRRFDRGVFIWLVNRNGSRKRLSID